VIGVAGLGLGFKRDIVDQELDGVESLEEAHLIPRPSVVHRMATGSQRTQGS
jgi:hypothetical protein